MSNIFSYTWAMPMFEVLSSDGVITSLECHKFANGVYRIAIVHKYSNRKEEWRYTFGSEEYDKIKPLLIFLKQKYRLNGVSMYEGEGREAKEVFKEI